jgi:5-methylcytosine-specific restriction endonuclease McrA
MRECSERSSGLQYGRMNYRNRKILDEARHHECQYCGRDDGTIVAAHSNKLEHGKGMGIKAHDVFIAFLCCECHDIVDGRKYPHMDQIAREQLWTTAHCKTVKILQRRKLLDKGALRLLGA